MNVGIVGLGKLGLPVAYAMASRGLTVYGHDPLVTGPPEDCSHEQGLAEIIEQAEDRMRFCPLDEVVKNCDVIFVAVQTPHEPRFEGVTPLPEDRADFDYSRLKVAVGNLADSARRLNRHVTLAVISTVLPGTMARHVEPLLGGWAKLVYNPSFIAMGTTIRDFLDPEFVLLGGDIDGKVEDVYRAVYGFDKPRHARVSVQDAELVKVAYNTFIGLKIAFANTLMEVCHKTGGDVDEVTGALKLAHRRLISPAYLDGGMGDGGGCHPRDNIALSWLARELDLSFDLFGAAMECREQQAAWLHEMIAGECNVSGLEPAILGIAYKPGSHITTGSPALLVKGLHERANPHQPLVPTYDPRVPGHDDPHVLKKPHVYLIGCKHPEFQYAIDFPAGSVVIDPFRYIPDQPDVRVVRLGQWEPAPTGISRSTTPPLAA